MLSAALAWLIAGTAAAAPVARAGVDILAYPRDTIILDASASEGTALAYRWAQLGGPPVALEGTASPSPSFQPTEPGRYTFELTVLEGNTPSAPDEIDVVVTDPSIGTRYGDAPSCAHTRGGSAWLGLALLALVAPRRQR